MGILNLGSHALTGGNKYKTQNQVQIFCMIKYIEDFEVTLHTHLVHSFIIAWI